MGKFGEKVEGYKIPVLNEREIRASSGILFLFVFISIVTAGNGDFLMIKYFVIFFFTDFIIRIFVNPKYSPSLIIGRLIVRKQTPEYVGAPQKKFAWVIGFVLASTMLVLLVFLNSFSIISGLLCFICAIFLFFESAFGICIGCKIYGWFYKDKAQYCPGEVCEIKDRHEIQKTSKMQLIVVLVFGAYVLASVLLFNDFLSQSPGNLWEILGLV